QVLNPRGRNPYAFGYAAATDTAKVNELLSSEKVQSMLPRNTELMWGASPFQVIPDQRIELFELIGVNAQVELTGDVIEEARINFDPTTNQPLVSMNMDSEGARRWARITGANIGKPVAIILDNY